MLTITPGFKADSPRRWAELRAEGPVHRIRLETGLEVWAVLTYDAAREALTHPLLLKDSTPAEAALAAAGFTLHKPGVGIGGNMLEADPPEHTRLRRLVAGAFSPRRVEALAPRIHAIAAELLDRLDSAEEDGAHGDRAKEGGAEGDGAEANGAHGDVAHGDRAEGDRAHRNGAENGPHGSGAREVDLVGAYTAPLPIAVIGELLGVPGGERAGFREWTTAAVSAPSPEQREGVRKLNAFLSTLIGEKRAAPGDDLLSALIVGGGLSDAEMLGTAALMVVAGHDTTVNLLGNALVGLLGNPRQADVLRARPELIGGAVEEFLRYDPPVEQASKRYAAGDLTLAGQPIRRGDVVAVMLGSASRDAPQVGSAKADAERQTARGKHDARGEPDVLDVERRAARHVAFGHGIHHCLGAPLARLEATIALGALLQRFPRLRPAAPLEEVQWVPSGMMRGPLSIPVRLR
ncbi:cytochrome P450 family protein [Actinoplanes sp. CA-131856]